MVNNPQYVDLVESGLDEGISNIIIISNGMKKKKTSLNDEVMVLMFKVLGSLLVILVFAVSVDIANFLA